jgi:hypothetical protein
VPDEDTPMPEGWVDDPNWGSDASVWAEMEDSAKPQKASGKRRKKRAHNCEPPGARLDLRPLKSNEGVPHAVEEAYRHR